MTFGGQKWFENRFYQQSGLAALLRDEQSPAPQQKPLLGGWKIDFKTPGIYRFVLRKGTESAPEELTRIRPGTAHIRIGNRQVDYSIRESMPDVTIEIKVKKPGVEMVECWFTGQRADGKPSGAYSVNIKKKGIVMKNYAKKILGYLLAGAAITAAQAQQGEMASTSFVETFESYSEQRNWSGGVNGWRVSNNSEDQYISIVSNNSDFSTGTRALEFVDRDTITPEMRLVNQSFGRLVEDITVRFDFKPQDHRGGPTLFLDDGENNTGLQLALYFPGTMLMMSHDGQVMNAVSGFPFQSYTWYRVEISIANLNSTNAVYDLRVWESNGDGSSTMVISEEGLPLRSDIRAISRFRLGGNIGSTAQGLSLVLDNVEIRGTSPMVLGRKIFVSPAGNDGWSGMKKEPNEDGTDGPFRTIQRAVDHLEPGDICYVREGVYRESVTFEKSGTKDAPITLSAYPGEWVVLKGTKKIAGVWENHRDNIYKTTVDSDFIQLFVDGAIMVEARWPNTSLDQMLTREGWSQTDEGSNYGIIFDQALAETGVDWSGATAVLNVAHQFFTWAREVQNHAAGSNSFEYEKNLGLPEEHWYMEEDHPYWIGQSYYLFGKLEALDIPGEWFLDRESRTLYLWVPDGGNPDQYEVEYKAHDYVLSARNISHLKIDGINPFGATVDFQNLTDSVVKNMHFRFPTQMRGIHTNNDPEGHEFSEGLRHTNITGQHNLLRNISLAHTSSGGLFLRGEGNVLENAMIYDVNWSGTLQYSALALVASQNSVLRRSTVFNVGGINVWTPTPMNRENIVEYNHIYNGGSLARDVTLLYTAKDQGGSVYRYNWIHDNLSESRWTAHGIRGDEITENLYVHNNVVWNAGSGITLKGNRNRIYNNTVLATFSRGIYLARCNPWMWDPENFSHQETLTVNNVVKTLCVHRDLHAMQEDGEEYPGDTSHNHIGRVAPTNRGCANITADINDNRIGGELLLEDPMNLDFRPLAGAAYVNAGRIVPGITDSFSGSAPDLGAYERGGDHWLPGHKNGIVIVPVSLKGNAAMVKAHLKMPVLKEVTISLRVGGRKEQLIFTPCNWMKPQMVKFVLLGDQPMYLVFSTENWGVASFAIGKKMFKKVGKTENYFEKPDLQIESLVPVNDVW